MGASLEGKVAVVTGGASGIGLATVERFVDAGARVVFCDLPVDGDDALDARLGSVRSTPHHHGRAKGGPHDGDAIAARLGDAARFVPADVSDPDELAAVIDAAVTGFGRLDVLYNNAGISGNEKSIADCPIELFDRTIEVNLRAVWVGIKLAAPVMVAQRSGSIISTGSVAALSGMRGLGAYSAAKAGVIGLTRAAAAELSPSNVRVNCICPGGIVTPIARATFGMPDLDLDVMRAAAAGAQPIPRAGEAFDIAAAALWLASDDASFVSGQVITVDGGATAEFSAGLRDTDVGEALDDTIQEYVARNRASSAP